MKLQHFAHWIDFDIKRLHAHLKMADIMNRLLFGLILFLPYSFLHADEVRIAVASNFYSTIEKISDAFTHETGHKIIINYGSTGKLYAQIMNGAPFEVFLSADQAHPKKLVPHKKAIESSIFTYAVGKLVLWSAGKNIVDSKGEVLHQLKYKHLSIANPKLSPYGLAAQEVLEKLDLWGKVQRLLVIGENINQAHQYVISENAELGFVTQSQIINRSKNSGSNWIIPQHLYTPIRQNAVLLEKGKNSITAKLFLEFLKGNTAHKIIKEHGYDLKP